MQENDSRVKVKVETKSMNSSEMEVTSEQNQSAVHGHGGGLLCQELPPDIEGELNEDLELKASCIEQIRTWITENEEFYGRTDDSFILRYLRVCKFNVENAKQRILRRYKVRNNYAKYFERTEENERAVEDLIRNKVPYSMNYAGNSKTNVMVGHIGGYGTYPTEPFMMIATALITEILFEDPRVQVNGIEYVGDLAGFTLSFILQMTPAALWRIFNLVAVSVPTRIKGFHVINVPRIAHKIIYIFQFFLSKKLRNRFFIHKDLESLHKHISPECLPFELGGTAGPEQDFVDATIEWFRNGKEVNTKNQLYGINKAPQTSDNFSVSSANDGVDCE